MSELAPMPLAHLVRRALAEHAATGAVYDLPERKWYVGDPDLDLSVDFHGERASTPVGPAAGPQSQLAQNIVLSYLGGGRIMELKTVQVLDELEIPRPCIDATNVGYNVEWSQELRVFQSLEEYAKAWMLLEILDAAGVTSALKAPRPETLFDLSVGYDLEGVRTEKVTGFIRSMMDASEVIEHLRKTELTGDLARFAELEFSPKMSDCVTLSTFHGCPADEIEGICNYLLDEIGIHVVVKMNPTLLGYERVCELLNDRLGYADIKPVETEFAHDLKWDEALGIIERLRKKGAEKGLTVGAKFTNTLVVENHKDFFPESETRMYLSGAPLHVISLTLAHQFRQAAGPEVPISFSAGIDAGNFADAVACGLTPITTCTDLLKPGGYGRLSPYLTKLEKRLRDHGVTDLPSFIHAEAGTDPSTTSLAEASMINMARVVEAVQADPRYSAKKNTAIPRKIGSQLVLFDCINCDKCVPVCPNDANFAYELPIEAGPTEEIFVDEAGELARRPGPDFAPEKDHQLANYADFCNECGNCDTFCPEDGGPYVEKPRFFMSEENWRLYKNHGGFYLEASDELVRALGHIDGVDYRLELDPSSGRATLSDAVLELTLVADTGAIESARVVSETEPRVGHSLGAHPGRVILTLVAGVLDPSRPNYVNAARLSLP